jgi:hypothetical protein
MDALQVWDRLWLAWLDVISSPISKIQRQQRGLAVTWKIVNSIYRKSPSQRRPHRLLKRIATCVETANRIDSINSNNSNNSSCNNYNKCTNSSSRRRPV